MTLAPWVEDAHVAPTAVKAKPRRHSKPHESGDGDGAGTQADRLAGRAEGLEPSDIIHAITAATGLDGEQVRNVRVLERFTLLECPSRTRPRDRRVSGTEVSVSRQARARRDLTSFRVVHVAPGV